MLTCGIVRSLNKSLMLAGDVYGNSTCHSSAHACPVVGNANCAAQNYIERDPTLSLLANLPPIGSAVWP